MSVRQIKAGTTDVSVNIRIIDSTDGTPETGVVYDTSGIDLWYRREGAVSVDITEATLAALTTAHTDSGFLHINDGWYRLDLPDAAVSDGVTGVQIGGTVTGMVVLAPYIELVDYDPYDSTRLGLTALPNAAADAAGGLPISDAGGLDLDGMNTNINDIETDTNELQTDDIPGTLATIAGYLDTEISAILADTNELQTDDVPGLIAALNNISTAQVNAEVDTALADVNLDHLVGTAAAIPAVPAGTYIDQIMDDGSESYDRATDSLQAVRDRGDAAWTTGAGTGLTALASGTAQGGTASTIQLAAGETFADSELNGNVVKITGGTGAGQSRLITAYTGATDTATISPNWTTNPDATSVYEVVDGTANVVQVEGSDATDQIRDAVVDDATRLDGSALNALSVNDPGSQLAAQSDITGLNDPTAAAIRTEIDSNSTQLTAIIADTNELQTDDIPGTLATIAAYIDTEVSAILADTNELQTDDVPGLIAALNDPTAAAIRTEIDSNSTQLAAIVADTNELQTDDLPGLIAALNDPSVSDILTTQMTEAYAADGAAPTLAQALMMIQQMLGDFTISGTTLTVRKVDGSTTAATFTLSDATNPTALTRAG